MRRSVRNEAAACRRAALLCLSLIPLGSTAAAVRHEPWGKDAAGNPVELYTLSSATAEVRIATYGARIVSIRVPDRTGRMANILLGFDSIEDYLQDRNAVMGATIGRYANRIAGGEIQIAGTTYALAKNNGGNTLHGGSIGFQQKTWSAKPVADGVEMSLVSPDGDMGFPGTLKVSVAFRLEARGEEPALTIRYTAQTDKPTVVNLTNHAYFNLSGDPAGDVTRDKLRIVADAYTPTAAGGIPTGALEPVEGTPLDFRTPHPIGDAMPGRGYDNNFALKPHPETTPVSEAEDPESGRTLKVFTTEPGLQLYVPRAPGGRGAAPAASTAAPAAPRPAAVSISLETQHFPDSPHQPTFPSTTLQPGSPFQSVTTYQFGVVK